MQEISKAIFLNHEFAYIFLGFSLFFLFPAIFVRYKRIKLTAVVLFSVFLMFSVFEFALSCFFSYPVTEFHKDYLKDINKDNIFVLKHKRFVDKSDNDRIEEYYYLKNEYDNYFQSKPRLSLVYDVQYTVYPNYFRYTKGDFNSESNYVFLGCSFVFGIGLKDNETLPYCFSKLMDFQSNVLNCGVSGQGTTTALNILNNNIVDKFVKKNSKFDHFYYYFVDDHIKRNFTVESDSSCIDSCRYCGGRWIRNKQPLGKIKILFSKSYIFRKIFLPLIDKYLQSFYEDYLIEDFKKMDKIVREKYNSKLTIVIWPKFRGYIDKILMSGLDVIILPEYFSYDDLGYKIKYDGHPSEKANKETAEILYNHKNKQ
ncbi:MAG: hypothetical protein WC234_00665 [Endomicrobiaceae bacterium]